MGSAKASNVAVIGPAASTQVTSAGSGSAFVIPDSVVSPLAGIKAAATGSVTYTQGLPNDDALTPIPSSALSTPYSGTSYGGTYTATLTAPETGTYAISIYDPCVHCYTLTQVTLNGTAIINHPDTPPVSTIAASVTLTAGQKYTLAINGESSNLEWAPPSQLTADFAPAVAAAKVAQVAVVVAVLVAVAPAIVVAVVIPTILFVPALPFAGFVEPVVHAPVFEPLFPAFLPTRRPVVIAVIVRIILTKN